jgi:hypothetical protein
MRSIPILGWNRIPEGFRPILKFEDAPKWLRLLALTPVIERFAYPRGARDGYVALMPVSRDIDLDEAFKSGFEKVYFYVGTEDSWTSHVSFGATNQLTKYQMAKFSILRKIYKLTRAGRAILSKYPLA